MDVSDIQKRLFRLRGQVGAALAVDGAARVAGVLVLCIGLSFAMDRFFKLETAARAVILLANLGAVGYVVWRFLLSRLKKLPGEEPLAIAVEARFPELGDRLISALQLARMEDPEKYGMSPELIKEAVANAMEPVAKVRFRDVLAKARVAKVGALGFLAAALIAGWFVKNPEQSGSIWFQRNVLLRSVKWPQYTYLDVDATRFPNGVARIVRGADIVVSAVSVGEVHPEKVTIYFEDSEGAGGKATMKADLEQRTYRHEFREVAFPIVFHLEGGDEVTRDFRIELMEPPQATDVEVEVAFPDYADRAPVLVDLSIGDPEMLRGGSVTVRGRSSKPLQRAELVLGETEETTISATVTAEGRFEVTFAPQKTTMVGIRLRDTDGLSNPSLAPRFLVRVVPDRGPKVRLQLRGIGPMVVPVASIPFEVRLRDDVKVVSGRLETKRAAGEDEAPEPHVLPFDPEGLGSDRIERTGILELAPMDLNPGAFLTLRAHATDNAPQPHESKSDPVSLKVVSIEELLADLRRRQQEQRQEFEILIKREKRLRDRFLDLQDAPPSSPSEIQDQLKSESREQRQIARRVRSIERAMSQILDEMLNNHIDEPGRINDIRLKVVQGLKNIRTRSMGTQADALDDAARHPTEAPYAGTSGDELKRGYGRVIAAMESVLAHMQRVEGFMEIVEKLRALIRVSERARKDTEARLKKELEKFFGPGRDTPGEDGR